MLVNQFHYKINVKGEIDSHPFTVGLVWRRIAMLLELAEGCGIRTSNRNSHEEQAILLKSVVAPTRYHGLGAGREAPEIDLIIYSGTSIEVVRQDWSD